MMRERYKLRKWERRAETIRRKIWALREDMPDEGELHDAIMDAQIGMDDTIVTLQRSLEK